MGHAYLLITSIRTHKRRLNTSSKETVLICELKSPPTKDYHTYHVHVLDEQYTEMVIINKEIKICYPIILCVTLHIFILLL